MITDFVCSLTDLVNRDVIDYIAAMRLLRARRSILIEENVLFHVVSYLFVSVVVAPLNLRTLWRYLSSRYLLT